MDTPKPEPLIILEELRKLAKNANAKAENELIKIMISSILDVSPIIDKYSTWLLAGCGAIASIMIANISSVIPFLGSFGFKISLYLLMASAIIGLLQKFRAIKVQSFSTITERLLARAEPISSIQQQTFIELQGTAKSYGFELDVAPDLDIERIKNEFSAFAPFFMKNKSMENFDKGAKDELHGWRLAVGGFKWQIYFFVSQFILFIGFLLIAALCVNTV